jgi:RNA polymerase sigma-70 factor (ECF subfamily)
MAATQSGDGVAYESLLRELLPLLRAFVRKRLAQDAASEDVVQAVLLSLHRARHTYRPEQAFEPWLWAIARNAVKDSQRARRRLARREQPLPDDGALGGAPHAPPDDRTGGWFSREVDRALAQLPPSQQQAVVLLHGHGMTVAEAARRMQVSPGAVKARAHRAYTTLRALLQEPST